MTQLVLPFPLPPYKDHNSFLLAYPLSKLNFELPLSQTAAVRKLLLLQPWDFIIALFFANPNQISIVYFTVVHFTILHNE